MRKILEFAGHIALLITGAFLSGLFIAWVMYVVFYVVLDMVTVLEIWA